MQEYTKTCEQLKIFQRLIVSAEIQDIRSKLSCWPLSRPRDRSLCRGSSSHQNRIYRMVSNELENSKIWEWLPIEGRLAFPPWSLSNWLPRLRLIVAYWSWLWWLTSQNLRNEVRTLGVFILGRSDSRGLRAFVEKTCRRVSVEFGGRRWCICDEFLNSREPLYIGFRE